MTDSASTPKPRKPRVKKVVENPDVDNTVSAETPEVPEEPVAVSVQVPESLESTPPSPPLPPQPQYGPVSSVSVPTRNSVSWLSYLSFGSSLAGILFLPVLGNLAAIILGHIALHQLKLFPTLKTEKTLALIGTILGWIMTGLGVLSFVVWMFILIVFAVSAPAFMGHIPVSHHNW